jgi:hypothetical protein
VGAGGTESPASIDGMSFSGGDYDEVARWLWNFLTSHAKREDPRVEVTLDHGGDREGTSYAATLSLHGRVTPPMELTFREVADNRGKLDWCRALAARTRMLVREQLVRHGLANTRQ